MVYFDIVHCNSVIEHILSVEHRARLAREIRRVGCNWFVQTPNRYFLVEPHTYVPFGQYLPRPLLHAFVRYARGIRGDDLLQWELLDRRELRALFPEGQLIRERFFGMTKCLVVIGGERAQMHVDLRPTAARMSPLPPS